MRRSHNKQLEDQERSHNEQIQEKEKLKQSLKAELEHLKIEFKELQSQTNQQLEDKERAYNQQLEDKEKLERSLQAKIEQLEKEIEEFRSHNKQLKDKELSHNEQLQQKEKLERSHSNQHQEKDELEQIIKDALEQQLPSLSRQQLPSLSRFTKSLESIEKQQEKLNEYLQKIKQVQFITEDLGNRIELEMIAIPGGKFMMGSPIGEGKDKEKPQHEVIVQSFFMGKYSITQAQYGRVMGVNPSRFKGNDLPVEGVSWNNAVEFCQRLSKQTGKEYRLPMEAEWEYACRARTITPYYFGDDITDKLANYGMKVRKTTAVGQYPPNDFGLYDMYGNVREWCQDDWHGNYEGAPQDGSAWLSTKSNRKVIRGSSWFSPPDDCRSATRGNGSPEDAPNGVGFRVVCRVPRT